MSKPKIDSVSQSCANRSFTPTAHVEPIPLFEEVGNSVAVATINVEKMAQDAAEMQDYIAKGGKQNESRGVKFIKASGLFANTGIRR